jgi:hypothetical protein
MDVWQLVGVLLVCVLGLVLLPFVFTLGTFVLGVLARVVDGVLSWLLLVDGWVAGALCVLCVCVYSGLWLWFLV